MHLLIPFASSCTDAAPSVLSKLQLPHLQALLSTLKPTARDEGDEYQLSLPHERVVAQAMGWSGGDGCLPWAADLASQDGLDTGDLAWGLVQLTHWHVSTEQLTLLAPEALALQDAEARALFDTMAPLFHAAGWVLAGGSRARWYVAHESLQNLPTACLDRVIGRNPEPWVRPSLQARSWSRLQVEVQMLLHQHPVNTARQQRGLLPANSLWLSGCGVQQPRRHPTGLTLLDDLRQPLLQQDTAQWLHTWQNLDNGALRAAVQARRQGQSVSLTLCGERHAQRFDPPPPSARPHWWRQWTARRAARRLNVATLLGDL